MYEACQLLERHDALACEPYVSVHAHIHVHLKLSCLSLARLGTSVFFPLLIPFTFLMKWGHANVSGYRSTVGAFFAGFSEPALHFVFCFGLLASIVRGWILYTIALVHRHTDSVVGATMV